MDRISFVTLAIILLWMATGTRASSLDSGESADSLCVKMEGLRHDVEELKVEAKLNSDCTERLTQESETIKANVDSLRQRCDGLFKALEKDRIYFDGQIAATNDSVRVSKTELQSQLSGRTFWGVILLIILLLAIAAVAYYYHKKIRTGNTSIDEVRKAQESLQKVQTSLQEESIKLDSKLVELIETRISATPQETGSKEPDHSLALKVADEIVRMEMNLSRMDSSVRGHRQLSKAVGRIKDNFKANGYEIVDMLGKPYNEGMKVVANFVADESLDEGKQIITGITKPQINYNGKMIQAAQITVSQNI